MQSNQLLRGDFDRYFMGNKKPKGPIYQEFDENMFKKLLNILELNYDIVCTTNMSASYIY